MVGATHRRGQAPAAPARPHTKGSETALAAARYQVIPSITAAMAAARTAIVAVSTVTARADRRSSRSRRACETAAPGEADGIAGRISTRIIGCCSFPGPPAPEWPRLRQRASGLKPWSCECDCKRTRSQTRVERSAILLAAGEQRVNATPPAAAASAAAFSIALARSMALARRARKELRAPPREPID